MSIIERIILIIDKKSFTMSDLCRHLDIGTSTMTNWKKRNTDPPAKYIIPICEFLNVSANYLLTGIDECKNQEVDNKVLKTFHQLNEDNQDIIIGKMKELLKEQKYDISISTDNESN